MIVSQRSEESFVPKDEQEIQGYLEEREQLQVIVENATEMICRLSAEGKYLYVSPVSRSLLGYAPEEMLGQNAYEFFHPEDLEKIRETHAAFQGPVDVYTLTYRVRKKDGSYTWFETINKSKRDESKGEVVEIIAISRDISKRKELEKELYFQATHDQLTELPTRNLFYDRLGAAIRRARRNKTKLAVLFFDLDKFKQVNDHYGHMIGDKVLKIFARRLSECMREVDTVARIGGDEFAALLEDLEKAKQVDEILKRIFGCLNPPMTIDSIHLQVKYSVGISLFPDNGEKIDLLISRADKAMYVAKANQSVSHYFQG